jgi:hypothetical protein
LEENPAASSSSVFNMSNISISVIARKLGPLIRLLASDKPGEVVAAVEAIKRVLASAGFDLNDLANVIGHPLPAPAYVSPPTGWREQATYLLRYGRLTDWENGFLRSLLAYRRPLTSKQMTVLRRILDAKAKEVA